MPEETLPTKIEVETTKPQTGKITIFGNISNPTPTKLALVTKALRYFIVGSLTIVAAYAGPEPDALFTLRQAKIAACSGGLLVFALGGVDIAIGVKPEEIK